MKYKTPDVLKKLKDEPKHMYRGFLVHLAQGQFPTWVFTARIMDVVPSTILKWSQTRKWEERTGGENLQFEALRELKAKHIELYQNITDTYKRNAKALSKGVTDREAHQLAPMKSPSDLQKDLDIQIRVTQGAIQAIGKAIATGRVQPKISDLHNLVKVYQLLSGGVTERTEIKATVGPVESVRVQQARASGDEVELLEARRDEALEAARITDALIELAKQKEREKKRGEVIDVEFQEETA